MNKKKDIIALALSVSFVMGGASISHADEINTDTTSYISEKQPSESENKSSNQIEDKENEDVTEVVNNSNTNEVQNLELSEEKTPEAQKAQEEATEPNYAEDEKKIKDYSGEERYRSTQMEQGDGTDAKYVPPDEKGNFIDGYRYHSSEPSATSEDKTQWGVEIEIDKEKGQRTYTDFYFTNTGNMGGVLDTGNVSANDEDEKIAGGEKDPNYKATSEIEISGSRNQRNLNLYASEEDLKHINNKDNTNTTMAWQG